MRPGILPSLVSGCAGQAQQIRYPGVFCPTESRGPGIPVDEPSALGFAGSDVLGGMETDFVLPVVATSDDTTVSRDFRFTFTPAGDPHVEERQPVVVDGHQAAFCLSGPTLRIPVTVDVAVDGWFAATGPGEIAAQGVEAETIWVSASLDVDPSQDLEDAAKADHPSICDPADIALRLAQVELPFTPWSEGPVGGISMRTCDDRTSISLYDWGERIPPDQPGERR